MAACGTFSSVVWPGIKDKSPSLNMSMMCIYNKTTLETPKSSILRHVMFRSNTTQAFSHPLVEVVEMTRRRGYGLAPIRRSYEEMNRLHEVKIAPLVAQTQTLQNRSMDQGLDHGYSGPWKNTLSSHLLAVIASITRF
jgi:hypothetical protein